MLGLKKFMLVKWVSNRKMEYLNGVRPKSNLTNTAFHHKHILHGPLARYGKLRVAHAPGMPGTFSPPPRFSDPDMHLGTCMTHVAWCMPGSLTSGFLWSWWRGKRSRRKRNPQFCVSGKRPMLHRFCGYIHIWHSYFVAITSIHISCFPGPAGLWSTLGANIEMWSVFAMVFRGVLQPV